MRVPLVLYVRQQLIRKLWYQFMEEEMRAERIPGMFTCDVVGFKSVTCCNVYSYCLMYGMSCHSCDVIELLLLNLVTCFYSWWHTGFNYEVVNRWWNFLNYREKIPPRPQGQRQERESQHEGGVSAVMFYLLTTQYVLFASIQAFWNGRLQHQFWHWSFPHWPICWSKLMPCQFSNIASCIVQINIM